MARRIPVTTARYGPGMSADSGLDTQGLARLAIREVRDVWKNEAHDFTPWLAEHIDVMASAIGLDDITVVQTEKRVGAFSLDILAEDAYGRTVIIENQLESSDHNHLGQLLAYASGLDASIIVWVAPGFREEHRSTLDWLNEHTDSDVNFFGVTVKVVSIADSPPAPVFDLVVKPNAWDREVQQAAATAPSEVNEQRQALFRRAFELMGQRIPGFNIPKAQASNWTAFRSGPFGTHSMVFDSKGRFRVEVYLEAPSAQLNKLLFDELYADRDTLQALVSEPLTWERMDHAKASRIAIYRDAPDLVDPAQIDACADWAADRLAELLVAFEDRVRLRAKQLAEELANS